MGEALIDQVALSLIPGLGPVTIKQLISYCGSATAVFEAKTSHLRKIPGIGDKTIHLLVNNAPRNQAIQQLALASRHNVQVISYMDTGYPTRLRQIDTAPTVLYTKGKISSLNSHRTIGIVGTRKATDYGRRVLGKILEELHGFVPTIVSGLAYGIDIAAHREAINLNLPTVGVLGNSLEKIYPHVHTSTANRMLENGGVISELKFGTKAEPFYFPARNRIIAGLSDALVLVEARNKGGALITAAHSTNYKRPCFAIPGPIDSPASEGCHALIAKGAARILTKAKDIAQALNWSDTVVDAGVEVDSGIEKKIVSILRAHPEGIHIDQLCRKTLVPINKMGTFILNLELRSMIKALPGKKFTLIRQ
jgi:DNA processing protein